MTIAVDLKRTNQPTHALAHIRVTLVEDNIKNEKHFVCNYILKLDQWITCFSSGSHYVKQLSCQPRVTVMQYFVYNLTCTLHLS